MTYPLRLAAALAALLLGLSCTADTLADKSAEPGAPRPHPRLKREQPPGRREKLSLGVLFLPAALKPHGRVPLLIHFHGGTWLPEVAAARHGGTAVITVQLGSGSAVYGKPFADPKRFATLLAEAETKAGVGFGPVTLTAWSAGYGAVRAILREPSNYHRVRGVLLLDGLHAGYTDHRAAARKAPLAEDLAVFVQFARDAAAGKKRMLVTHTQIVPGTYASTTETADYLLRALGLERRSVRQPGPMGTHQTSEARRGGFMLLGFAGAAAADHVDQLHALPDYLKMLAVRP
jgi:hypothetical protein